ncbi:hypothetical protein L210DRAFT_3388380 [Boletus edulis BED1]|uniref:tRNA-splicing endonuclease subunit Sen2 n=1 Tax=Boletus edulis BED1 TaxID=1328754 RepID=A0AAD4C5A8_BOLED|nr:hypothetical protein L210DRAFT_3388380 [Boletus edulis BED1]
MSLIQPSSRSKTSQKTPARRTENNRIYAHPLPIILTEPSEPSFLRKTLHFFGVSASDILNPHCQGVLDVATRSVWVLDMKDAMILWQRGFFGKGDLSRSEPSWLARQINARKLAKKGMMTSEEVTAKRRAERKQFKLDRAKAMAAAAAEAEVAFQQGHVVSTIYAADGTRMIPSAATWKPNDEVTQPEQDVSRVEEDDGEDDEEPIENVEHLQLTLQEAFFLSWNLDCLSISNPDNGDIMTLSQMWNVFQNVHIASPTLAPSLDPPQHRRFDNPFLVNYVIYHHYRSLGWVVKSGIKFCVDYLLYKRGPIFAHAEFAIVVCPVYEDPADQDGSSFDLNNTSPFSWSWLSTINRVNSQVQKTLVLSYVTIPARSRVSEDVLSSPACFVHYTVREVVLRRFVPARMRD